MNKVYIVDKPVGKTPLEMISLLKQSIPEVRDVSVTYAGRLDPLAHGVLILLAGDAISQRDEYLQMPKQYSFTALFGVQTDTYDYLGMLQEKRNNVLGSDVKSYVNSFVSNHLGKQTQKYPPYSSKPVNGKPLFQWAREGKLDEIFVPEHEIEIYDFNVTSIESIQKDMLLHQIIRNITKVKGDFRQKAIKNRWKQFINKAEQSEFTIANFTVSCSSGTYVRSLANDLGNELGCGAIALNIQRTAVGEYTLDSCMQL